MTHYASPEFWKLLNSLPHEIQKVAYANYELLKQNPRHPSLQLKKAAGYWSVRVGTHYRALVKQVQDGILWGWIGTHAEYDFILSQ